LEEPVQIAARRVVRLALIEVAAQPDVAVRQGEDRLRLPEQVQPQPPLPDGPRLDREVLRRDHPPSSNSPRSRTTVCAPPARKASARSPRSTPPTQPNPPARPASTPAMASSKTAHRAGATPSL